MAIDGPLEVELKYRLRQEGAAERFAAAEEIGAFTAAGGARSSQYEDRYLDTRDGALERAGYFARLRQSRSTTVVTVKSTATTEGSLQRRSRSSKGRLIARSPRSPGHRPRPGR